MRDGHAQSVAFHHGTVDFQPRRAKQDHPVKLSVRSRSLLAFTLPPSHPPWAADAADERAKVSKSEADHAHRHFGNL